MRRLVAVLLLLAAGCGTTDGVAVLEATGLCVDGPWDLSDPDNPVVDEPAEGLYLCLTEGSLDTDAPRQTLMLNTAVNNTGFHAALTLDNGRLPIVGDGWVMTPSDHSLADTAAETSGGKVIRSMDDLD